MIFVHKKSKYCLANILVNILGCSLNKDSRESRRFGISEINTNIKFNKL